MKVYGHTTAAMHKLTIPPPRLPIPCHTPVRATGVIFVSGHRRCNGWAHPPLDDGRYRTMNDCIQRWKHHSNGKTWSRISAHKEPMVEPRTAADLKVSSEGRVGGGGWGGGLAILIFLFCVALFRARLVMACLFCFGLFCCAGLIGFYVCVFCCFCAGLVCVVLFCCVSFVRFVFSFCCVPSLFSIFCFAVSFLPSFLLLLAMDMSLVSSPAIAVCGYVFR